MPNVYNEAKAAMARGDFVTESEPFLMLLMQADYTYDPDHEFLSDVLSAGTEISVVGYSRQSVPNVNVQKDDAADQANIRADEVPFAGLSAGETIASAIIFPTGTGVASSQVPYAYYLLPAPLPTGAGAVVIQFQGLVTDGHAIQLLDS